MRLLILTNMWPNAKKPHFGVFVADRAAAYERRGATVDVVASRRAGKGLVRNVFKYASLAVRVLWRSLMARPDLIEAHYLRPTALIARVAAGALRRPYVLYAHGSDIVDAPSGPTIRAVRAAAEVHTNSQASADRLKAVFGDIRVVVSPPGVDLELFRPGAPERGRIAFVGDLVAHKGADVLLDAVQRLDEARLTVVGDGPERQRLESQASALGISSRVRWLGSVDHPDVADHMRGAWVAAVPSRRDALGQVAVEALACGVPVVVSDVGGLASAPDAYSGTVVEPESAAALADALARWLEMSRSERAETAVSARRRAQAFDIDVVAAEALRRFRALIDAAVDRTAGGAMRAARP